MKQHLLRRCAALIVAALGFVEISNAVGAESSPVIVPCDQPVKSRKRGVCLNTVSQSDFMALSPSVSWFYSWHYEDTNHVPKAAGMEFIPMAWGDRRQDLDGLKRYLQTNKPSYVLAINEPNLKDQAFISPEKTSRLYKEIKAIADAKGVPVVGPNMALGSPTNGSIKAMDPIENKEVTYTFMTPFLKAFYHFVGNTEVPAVAAHTYGNAGELKWMVGMMHKEFARPVWVTEFADWHAANDEAERNYMIQTVDFMERTPYVEGYAWFKERVQGNQKLSLLGAPGKLTKLGEAYVAMPVHEPDIYYQLPGKLQSESYVAMQGADIAPTTDSEGFLEMRCVGASDWVDYNVAVKQAGSFGVKLRASTSPGGKIKILAGEKALALVTVSGAGWQTTSGAVELPAGTQTIRVQCDQPTRLNWMEFSGR